MHSLLKIEFQDLTMCITDHKEMLLKHWIWLNVDVKDVWRSIQCFVTSELVTLSRKSNYLSLILDISWLWSVNAIIIIRNFKILIENSLQEERIREVIDSKLVFCDKHNLLIYFKSILAADKVRVNAVYVKLNSKSFSSSDSENDLFKVEDFKSSFQ